VAKRKVQQQKSVWNKQTLDLVQAELQKIQNLQEIFLI